MKFAVKVLAPVEPFATVTLVCGVVPLEPVQPVKLYPVFVGLFRVITSLSTVYVVGLAVSSVPPSRLYVIV